MMQFALSHRHTFEPVNMIDALEYIIHNTRIVRHCTHAVVLPDPKHFHRLVLTIVNVLLVTRCVTPVITPFHIHWALTCTWPGLWMYHTVPWPRSANAASSCRCFTRLRMVCGMTICVLFLHSPFFVFYFRFNLCCTSILISIQNTLPKVKTILSVCLMI